MYFYFYQVFMILSLIISASLAVLTWRHRQLPGAGSMVALLTAIFVWTLGFYLESHSHTLNGQLFFNNIGYLGSMTVPVAWLTFSLNYSNNRRVICGWRTLYFCIFPAVITVLIWTNSLHHLMWSNEHLGNSGAFLITIKDYGPFFWVALAHNYLLIMVGGIVLVRRLFIGTRLYMGQIISLLVGVCLPWIWNIIYVFKLVDLPRKDLTPAIFAISGFLLALGLVRYHMFASIPFARQFIVRQMGEGVLVFNAGNVLVETNPKAMQIMGLKKNIVGEKLEKLLHLSPVFAHLVPGRTGREEISLLESGEKRVYEMETLPMANPVKQTVGWLVILHDITDLKQTEEQYRLITEHSADVIYKLNIGDEKYTYVSPSCKRLFGYTDIEALALTPKDMLTPDSYEKQRLLLLQDIRDGVNFRIYQLEAIHKDGHIIPIEVHGSLIRGASGEPREIVGVARDVTERRKMEEQLIVQDRLVSIGQLTSSLALELNNPLTGIINFATLLLNRDLPEDVKEDIGSILEEARRTARTVKNLLVFSRKGPQEKEPVDINDAIRKVLELREYEQRIKNIRVEARLAPDLPEIVGNSSELQQVFFNIVVNAEYFMEQAHRQGNLTITTEKAGEFVRAAFADDGTGISAADMKHLFAPFYTTKEAGKGMGLSLSICHGIITEHGGRIWAESQPGKGSTFIIELPVYREPPQNGNG